MTTDQYPVLFAFVVVLLVISSLLGITSGIFYGQWLEKFKMGDYHTTPWKSLLSLLISSFVNFLALQALLMTIDVSGKIHLLLEIIGAVLILFLTICLHKLGQRFHRDKRTAQIVQKHTT
jgi:hypothetical protein